MGGRGRGAIDICHPSVYVTVEKSNSVCFDHNNNKQEPPWHGTSSTSSTTLAKAYSPFPKTTQPRRYYPPSRCTATTPQVPAILPPTSCGGHRSNTRHPRGSSGIRRCSAAPYNCGARTRPSVLLKCRLPILHPSLHAPPPRPYVKSPTTLRATCNKFESITPKTPPLTTNARRFKPSSQSLNHLIKTPSTPWESQTGPAR